MEFELVVVVVSLMLYSFSITLLYIYLHTYLYPLFISSILYKSCLSFIVSNWFSVEVNFVWILNFSFLFFFPPILSGRLLSHKSKSLRFEYISSFFWKSLNLRAKKKREVNKNEYAMLMTGLLVKSECPFTGYSEKYALSSSHSWFVCKESTVFSLLVLFYPSEWSKCIYYELNCDAITFWFTIAVCVNSLIHSPTSTTSSDNYYPSLVTYIYSAYAIILN